MLRLRALLVSLAIVATTLVALPATAPPAAAVVVTGGAYYPLPQQRMFNTASGRGIAKKPLKPHSVTTLRATGRAGVPSIRRGDPSHVSMVVLSVTITKATADGHLTIYDASRSRPAVTSVTFSRGRRSVNLVTVPLDRYGRLKVYNSKGRTAFRADAVGFYSSDNELGTAYGQGTAFLPLTSPHGMADTRADFQGPLRPGEILNPELELDTERDNAGVRAVAVMITVTKATRNGALTAWKPGRKEPAAPIMYVGKSTTAATMAIVPTTRCRTCGRARPPVFNLRNDSKGRVHVRVEAVGYYLTTGTHGGYGVRPSVPTRISDSRAHLNGSRLRAGHDQLLTAPTSVATQPAGTVALIANVTVAHPTRAFRLRIGATGHPVSGNSLSTTAGRGPTADSSTVITLDDDRFFLTSSADAGDFTIDVVARVEPLFR